MRHKGSDKGSSGDGRRNNVPPAHGRIRAGEVRNPWGAGGKPKVASSTSMDDLLWQEASRIVSHDKNGPVDAKKRLVQEEFNDALSKKDSAARARLLLQLRESSARIDHERNALHTFFFEAKALLTEQFDMAKKLGKPLPDVVPHPDHIQICADEIRFNGPADRRGRAVWEQLKTDIRIAACLHVIIRDEHRRFPSAAVLQELKDIEWHRRRLMRCVPNGCNWKEEIYNRDSSLNLAERVVRELKETGYVARLAID